MMQYIKKQIFIAVLSAIAISGWSQELLNMDRSLEIAISNSPTMKQSELSLKHSREKLHAQRARLKSQFKLTFEPISYRKANQIERSTSNRYLNESAYSLGRFSVDQRILPTDGVLSLRNTLSYQYNHSESQRDTTTDKYFQNNLNLSLEQPLFTYNKTKIELEKVELSYEDALLRYLLQKLNLEKQVAQNFYQMYLLQMRLNIASEELKNNKESYGIIKNKVDGGLLALEELYQAEVNFESSKSKLYTAELNLLDNKDKFKVLIGMPLDNTIEILADVKADTVDVDPVKAIKHALTSRMELRQRQIDIKNARNNLIQARATNEFEGKLTASIGLQSENDYFESLFENTAPTPAVGLSLDIPLFDWGERKSEIRAAEASLKIAEIDHQVEQVDIEVNIRSVLRNLQNLENQIVIQEKTVKNAELTYDINLERYRNGDLTSLDLGIYQNQLSDKKMALTNAIIDYKLELLNLKIQTLYDFELDQPIIPEEILNKTE